MKEKKNEGITLIALVITIIVLLILAGVTLSTLFGNNGILTESKLAVETNKEANAKEQVQLAWTACETEYQSAWTKDSSVVKKDYFDSDDLNKNLGTGTVKSVGYVENGKSTVTYTLDGTEYEFEIANGQVYKVGQAPDVTEPEEKPNGPGSAEGSSAEWEFDSSTGTILSIKLNDSGVYAFNTSTIIIPSTIDGVKVKKLGRLYKDDLAGGFGIGSGGEYLKKVIISDGIEEIGEWAFLNCEAEEIVIPESVTKIDKYAFENCINLKEIRIPGSIKNISDSMFIGCRDMENVVLEEGVESIGVHAFWGFGNNCAISIPSTVKTIDQYAFQWSDINNLTVSESNPIYDSRNNCNAIIEKSTNKLIVGCQNTIIPNGVEIIGEGAFTDCEDLTDITIPSSVKTIEEDAFNYSGLTNITIENGLTTIKDYGFEYCQKLTNITIPSSVTSIGSNAFYYCNKLQAINIAKGSPLSESSSNFPWGTTKEKILFNQ